MKKNIELIQGYYKFLHMSKFLEKQMIEHDRAKKAETFSVSTEKKSHFFINTDLIKPILASSYQNTKQKNIFGYLSEIAAWRGIFSSMKESIESDSDFHNFIKKTLQNQFFPFMQILSLLRNILSHYMHSDLTLTQDSFTKQKIFLFSKDITIIHFKFTYGDYIKERTGSKNYGINIKINYKKLNEGMKLKEIVSTHNLYLLTELCYNLSKIYNVKYLQEKK